LPLLSFGLVYYPLLEYVQKKMFTPECKYSEVFASATANKRITTKKQDYAKWAS
jgi:hypothetical protein